MALKSTTVCFIIPLCQKPVKSLLLTTLDTSFKKNSHNNRNGTPVGERGRSNRSRISRVWFARFDTRLPPPPSCPISPLPAVADPGSRVLDRRRAAVCYSTLDSGEGGNLQIGFRTFSTGVPAWRPPDRSDMDSNGKSLKAAVWTSTSRPD